MKKDRQGFQYLRFAGLLTDKGSALFVQIAAVLIAVTAHGETSVGNAAEKASHQSLTTASTNRVDASSSVLSEKLKDLVLGAIASDFNQRARGSGDRLTRLVAGIPDPAKAELSKLWREHRIRQAALVEPAGRGWIFRSGKNAVKLELTVESPRFVMIEGTRVSLDPSQGMDRVFQAIYSQILSVKGASGWRLRAFSEAIADTPNAQAAEQAWSITSLVTGTWDFLGDLMNFNLDGRAPRLFEKFRCKEFISRSDATQQELRSALDFHTGFFAARVGPKVKALVTLHGQLVDLDQSEGCKATSAKPRGCQEVSQLRACTDNYLRLLTKAWAGLELAKSEGSKWTLGKDAGGDPFTHGAVQRSFDPLNKGTRQ